MTRLILATALIAAGTLVSSTAQACLSCEYVPEVVRNQTTSSAPPAYHPTRVHIAHEARESRAAKKRIAKSERRERSEKIAKADKVERVVKTAKVDRDEKPAKVAKIEKPRNEPVKVAKADGETQKPARVAAESEASSITVASAEVHEVAAAAAPAAVAAVDTATSSRPTDCKKFFASVGMTLTVPCE